MGHWHVMQSAMAIWITRHWTTEEILDELAEKSYFGGGAYGFKKAADIYFQTTPENLSDIQIATLLALESSPNLSKNKKELKNKTDRILLFIMNHEQKSKE